MDFTALSYKMILPPTIMSTKKSPTSLFFITVIGCYANTNNDSVEKINEIFEIEGLHTIKGDSSTGLEVTKIENGNYVFQVVYIDKNGKIYRLEWQSAYVLKNETNKYIFYWHTGRFDDNKPETNGLIVYELEAMKNEFIGTHFFPEESRTPPARVVYIKIR